ncbi:MAG TPA: hypothetical protein ENN47_10365 [Mesotoga infera]|uniref:Uncharacterized protein n=1 Tax=Mesotoga infera TaxID=1236046 RepID=A0A7C1GUG8_9BACT|nr:hypothetical protein [Mesotoga infera]
MVRSDAGIKHQTQGWARTAQVAMPAKIMPGLKAGEDHARSQCPLRGEDLQSQSADAGQSHFVRPVRLCRAEEPSLGTGYMVRVRKIGLIEAGY